MSSGCRTVLRGRLWSPGQVRAEVVVGSNFRGEADGCGNEQQRCRDDVDDTDVCQVGEAAADGEGEESRGVPEDVVEGERPPSRLSRYERLERRVERNGPGRRRHAVGDESPTGNDRPAAVFRARRSRWRLRKRRVHGRTAPAEQHEPRVFAAGDPPTPAACHSRCRSIRGESRRRRCSPNGPRPRTATRCPPAVFTVPELARVGLFEEDERHQGIDIDVLHQHERMATFDGHRSITWNTRRFQYRRS